MADLRQDLAVGLLEASVSIRVGRVEVVDAQFDGAAGRCDGLLGRDQREAAAGQADDGEVDADLAELPLGDVAGAGIGFAELGRPGGRAGEEGPAMYGNPPFGSNVG